MASKNIYLRDLLVWIKLNQDNFGCVPWVVITANDAVIQCYEPACTG
jgi:hypothetical protein